MVIAKLNRIVLSDLFGESRAPFVKTSFDVVGLYSYVHVTELACSTTSATNLDIFVVVTFDVAKIPRATRSDSSA